MNLVAAIGMRTVYTWDEVCSFVGMTKKQLEGRVRRGQLVKKFVGQYPFAQKDVNAFIVGMNNGLLSTDMQSRPARKSA